MGSCPSFLGFCKHLKLLIFPNPVRGKQSSIMVTLLGTKESLKGQDSRALLFF